MRRSARWLGVVAARGGGSEPTFTPSFASTNTLRSNELTPDGFTWAQGNPMVIDKFGKYIISMQTNYGGTGNASAWLVSNNFGATWLDPTLTGFSTAHGDSFLVRCATAYDSVNDCLHALWLAAAGTDGMIYRRYNINRDGSNNITGLTKAAGINLQIDYQNAGTMYYQHPCIFFEAATLSLTCIWAAANATGGTNKNEIRASKRIISNTAADAVAANWLPLTAVASTSTIGQSPQVPYTTVLVDTGVGGMSYPSAGMAANRDIYVMYNSGTTPVTWCYQKLTWGGSNYTVGAQVPICLLDRGGSVVGYNLKVQLGTSLKYDAAGRMWFGVATRNTGDTWTVGYINTATGVVSGLLDVYVAPTAHMSSDDFVTGDILWDAPTGRLMVAYTDLPAKAIYGVPVTPGTTPTLSKAATLWSAARPWDIPTLYESRDQGKILCAVRDFNDAATNNPPVYTPFYDGWFGRVTVA